jgi:hypothetical protein
LMRAFCAAGVIGAGRDGLGRNGIFIIWLEIKSYFQLTYFDNFFEDL